MDFFYSYGTKKPIRTFALPAEESMMKLIITAPNADRKEIKHQEVKMKKALSIIFALFFLIVFTSCSHPKTEDQSSKSQSKNSLVSSQDDKKTTKETSVSQSPKSTESDSANQSSSETESSSNQINQPSTAQKNYTNPSSFNIKGKWKNIGEGTYGQAQKGSIIVFDGTNCNFVSPKDTYAFYKDGNDFQLDCTTPLADTVSFTVKIIDNNNIDITNDYWIVELKRIN